MSSCCLLGSWVIPKWHRQRFVWGPSGSSVVICPASVCYRQTGQGQSEATPPRFGHIWTLTPSPPSMTLAGLGHKVSSYLNLHPLHSSLRLSKVVDSKSYFNNNLFAMAKIQRIGHVHQAPFWLVVVLLLGYQAVTRGENKLPYGQYTLDPQYFYRFWTSKLVTNRGAD